MEDLDPDLFLAIRIYKTCMSSKAERMQMLYHTHTCYLMAMYSQLSPDYKKGLSYSDFDFLDILDDSLTTKERAEKRKQNSVKKQSSDIDRMGEYIKNLAKQGKK
ncbi:hypothetical protein [Escherichia fergusonii]|uniref:hypothetical protein n=1 Tax=Escherichia fergusonii TaxID=564 RepID=UPI00200D3184|nr:hypothetical protein [Escherichia fergusonii]